jgi:hypothetical protein
MSNSNTVRQTVRLDVVLDERSSWHSVAEAQAKLHPF